MNEEIVVGDVVLLKSGSPAMTVTETGEDMMGVQTAWCVWFDNKATQQSGAFPLRAVTKRSE